MDAGAGKVVLRGALATAGITALGTAVFTAALFSFTNLGLAIGATVATWMGAAILVSLRAPTFLGPTIVALPLILVAAIFVLGMFLFPG